MTKEILHFSKDGDLMSSMKELKYIIGSLVIHGVLFSSMLIDWKFKQKETYMDSDVLLMGDGRGDKINPPKPKEKNKSEEKVVENDPDALKTHDKNAATASDSSEEAFGQGGTKALPYDTELTLWLQANKKYPKMARRLGQECENITLSFNVNPDGRLTDIMIKEKCEHEILNQAAIEIVKSGEPV
jgi:TonB family protein